MGKGRPGSGVELRPNSIRVNFTWSGERCRVTLELRPTEAHRKYAERLVSQIRAAIAAGTFDYAATFPESDRATASRNACNALETFSHYAGLYRKALGALAPATRSQYKLAANFWERKLGAKVMADIRHSELAALVGEQPWPSAKMRNNSLIPLRGIFALWVKDDPKRRTSPADGIANAKVQRARPDPIERGEVELVVDDMRKHYDPLVADYYEFAFFTGLRPEEQIALLWTKIDWRRRTVRIDRARTFKGGEKDTKTGEEREVDLNSRALAVLTRMRARTQLKKHGHVFENPVTHRPWHDERSQRDHYWKPALARTKVRERRAYVTRSTFISMCLAAGMRPGYVAAQAGHSEQMMWDSYAKWIPGAGSEMAKLEGDLTRNDFSETTISQG